MPTPALLPALRHRTQAVLTPLLLAAVAVGAHADTPGADLGRYRDKNRLLLFFAPSPTDSRYIQQAQRFLGKAKADGLKERDLLRFNIFERGTSRRDGIDLSVREADALRQRFDIHKGQFKVVLVGKDGQTAYSASAPISASQLFGLIDAMPMRRDEMRHQQKSAGISKASGAPGDLKQTQLDTSTGATAKSGSAVKAPALDKAAPQGLQPDKRYTPADVVKIQMEALQHNDMPKADAGIATVFAFASPGNREYTGPLAHFIQIVRAPAYLPMLNCKSITYDTIVMGENGDTAKQRVHIVAADGTRIAYLFLLSIQTDGQYAGCWMNDGCVRDTAPVAAPGDDA